MTKLFSVISFSLCMMTLYSCLGNDDSQWSSYYNNVPVTVVSDGNVGVKFVTDFDAVLIPASFNLGELSWLKEMRRAYISFRLADENQEFVAEPGRRYTIVLNEVNGTNRDIPTFIIGVDTLDTEYRANGNDSIALKNKSVISVAKGDNAGYVQNGYLNLTPTFAYTRSQEVYMLLYYDGEKDVDAAHKRVNLNFYFNNAVSSPTDEITSFISMKIPENIYYHLSSKGMLPKDSIEVVLNVRTVNGVEKISFKTTLEDLLVPSYSSI